MKICFNNLFPPMNKLGALLLFVLLLISYTTLKADDKFTDMNTVKVSFTKMPNNDLNIEISSFTQKKVDLYFFSSEGSLVKHIKTTTQRTATVKDMEKGAYLYQVFEKDKELKSGKLIFK